MPDSYLRALGVGLGQANEDGPLSGWVLNAASEAYGLNGWQWLFIVEAVPSAIGQKAIHAQRVRASQRARIAVQAASRAG
jgi:hypothetical protein